MIDPSSQGSGSQGGWTTGQRHPWVGHGTLWNIMRKSPLSEINLRSGYYTHCDLKRSGKLSNFCFTSKGYKGLGAADFAHFIRCKDFKRKRYYPVSTVQCCLTVSAKGKTRFYQEKLKLTVCFLKSVSSDIFSIHI